MRYTVNRGEGEWIVSSVECEHNKFHFKDGEFITYQGFTQNGNRYVREVDADTPANVLIRAVECP
jgi:hypothetical protein